ncbi:hypothetical protein LOD42_11075, partial [Xylella fastidiosa subsp. multiplex]
TKIERTATIANLTKKRHSKLSSSQFHKFIINIMTASIKHTRPIDLMPQREQIAKNQTAEVMCPPKNPFDERTSQQYLMPCVRLVQCQ